MIFLSMCFLVFYNYIVAQKGHYDFFFLHNYMDFITMGWPFGTFGLERRQWASHSVLSDLKGDNMG